MYVKGKLDVTQLSAEDRQCVYSELRQSNVNMHVIAGKIYATTSADGSPMKYNDQQYVAVLNICHQSGRYAIRYKNQWLDPMDPNVYHVGTDEHEATVAWYTPILPF